MSKADDYLQSAETEYSLQWLKRKHGDFETEWQNVKTKLNARFNNRGANYLMECLQFGGNSEFWSDFPNENEIYAYFKRCYLYAVRHIGYLSTDTNILCAVIVTETNRRNLFVYYLPITDKWTVKVMGNERSKDGHKLQRRDFCGEPLYNKASNRNAPLLSRSEFWKQRGGYTSYSRLHDDFYETVSKRYGAERGESTSRLKYTTEEQQKRFNRHEGDENDILPPIKGVWV